MSKVKNFACSVLTAAFLSCLVVSCAYQGLFGERSNKEQSHAKQ